MRKIIFWVFSLAAIWAVRGDVPVEFRKARWIGQNSPPKTYGVANVLGAKDKDIPRMAKNSARFRKTFQLPMKDIRSATIAVTGLGFYECEINGLNPQPLRMLAPSWSNPDLRAHYDVLDVKPLLNTGVANAVGVWLAPGYADDYNHCGTLITVL